MGALLDAALESLVDEKSKKATFLSRCSVLEKHQILGRRLRAYDTI